MDQARNRVFIIRLIRTFTRCIPLDGCGYKYAPSVASASFGRGRIILVVEIEGFGDCSPVRSHGYFAYLRYLRQIHYRKSGLPSRHEYLLCSQ